CLPCFLHSFPRKIKGRPIMHPHQRVTNFAAGVSLLQKVWERVEISERFRHLLPIHEQMRAMQPVAHEFFSCDAFAQRALPLAVGKNISDSTAMNVDLIAD